MGCAVASNPEMNIWFDACKTGNIEQVKSLLGEYAAQRDSRQFRIAPNDYEDMDGAGGQMRIRSFKYPYNLHIPHFTSLMYAILYNQPKVVELLIKEEVFINTETEAFIPTILESVFKQPIIESKDVIEAFKANNIQNFSYIPPNSTVLDICVFLDRLNIYQMIMDHIQTLTISQQDQILQHVNQHYQTNLMLLIKLQNQDANIILEKYGQLIIETQFDYENMLGENCTYLAAFHGNFKFFSYFLSMCSSQQYKQTVEVQLDQQQFSRDILDVFAKKRDFGQYQKCLKLYQMFIKGQYPPAPVWFNTNTKKQDDSNIMVKEVKEQPELIDYEVLDELDPITMTPQMKPKFTGSIFEDRQEMQQQITQQIANSVVQGIKKTRESGSEIGIAPGAGRRRSSFMTDIRIPKFVTDGNNNTSIAYDTMDNIKDEHKVGFTQVKIDVKNNDNDQSLKLDPSLDKLLNKALNDSLEMENQPSVERLQHQSSKSQHSVAHNEDDHQKRGKSTSQKENSAIQLQNPKNNGTQVYNVYVHTENTETDHSASQGIQKQGTVVRVMDLMQDLD